MKFALCDDQPAFLSTLLHEIESHCAKRDWECRHTLFHSAAELLAADLTGYQVLFLDIDMPGINGLDAAKELRRSNDELIIIFVTGYLQYAPAGYSVRAFRYLMKNQLQKELPACLDDLWVELYGNDDTILLQHYGQPTYIRLKNILYIEGTARRHVLIHVQSPDNEPLDCLGTLAEMDEQLAKKGFLRIQKSYLVNMLHLLKISNYLALLSNGESLKVSERGYSHIRRQHLLWKGQTM